MKYLFQYIQLIKNYPKYLSFGFIHYFFSSLGQTFLIGLFGDYFLKEFSINNEVYGIIYASATIGGSLVMQFVGGYLDNTKIRNYSLINGLVLAIFCMIIVFAGNFIWLGIGIMGLRLTGQGLMVLIGSTSIARYFKEERGKSLSLASLGISSAEAILPLFVSLLLGITSWEFTLQLLAFCVLGIFMPLSFLLIKKDDPFQLPHKLSSEKEETQKDTAGKKEMLKDPFFYLVIPSALIGPMFFTGLLIHQNLMADAFNWDKQWIGSSFIAFGTMRIITNFIAGPLIDSFSARKVFAFHLLPLFAGVICLLIFEGKWIFPFFLGLTGITMSLGALTKGAMWAETYGISKLGSIKSFVTMLLIFATALGPIIMGSYLERVGTFKDIFILTIILMGLFIITAFTGIFINSIKKFNKNHKI